MNGKLSRDLRRLAKARWDAMTPQYKGVFTVAMVYKQIKKEYKDEKGRHYTNAGGYTRR